MSDLPSPETCQTLSTLAQYHRSGPAYPPWVLSVDGGRGHSPSRAAGCASAKLGDGCTPSSTAGRGSAKLGSAVPPAVLWGVPALSLVVLYPQQHCGACLP